MILQKCIPTKGSKASSSTAFANMVDHKKFTFSYIYQIDDDQAVFDPHPSSSSQNKRFPDPNLHSTTPVFGFVFNGQMHLWVISTKMVYVLQAPSWDKIVNTKVKVSFKHYEINCSFSNSTTQHSLNITSRDAYVSCVTVI